MASFEQGEGRLDRNLASSIEAAQALGMPYKRLMQRGAAYFCGAARHASSEVFDKQS